MYIRQFIYNEIFSHLFKLMTGSVYYYFLLDRCFRLADVIGFKINIFVTRVLNILLLVYCTTLFSFCIKEEKKT